MLIYKQIKYKVKQKIDNSLDAPLELSHNLELAINEDIEKRGYLIHRVLRCQVYQHRQGNAHTKTRDEIRGGGKKPWKQKGSGRARAGSNRSPLWKGGGVTFGPRSSKKYNNLKINKKEKHVAIKNIIANKAANTFIVNNNFNTIIKPNTKFIIHELNKYNIDLNQNKKFLLIVDYQSQNLYKSIRNIPHVNIIQASNLNPLALLKADTILLTLDGFNAIKKIYNDKKL